ncbi:TolC family outer membrane protein [Paragemmobacter ruber]|uniref:TolC family outer membrane protein n=1 Tax=Paragemmobacter ruber TaxID=1985673 RepID=A0ABW9YB74_9RHOB|nr:TolC family outer membrane protein [Rhodobacter ruber]
MRGFLAAVAVSVLGFAAPPAQAETLADALASAYKNSQLLDQNEALLRAADEDVAQAVARLRPVVSFVAQAQNTQTTPDLATDGLQSTLSLAAQWTLFDFGRNRLGVEIAKETVLATREALKGLESQVLLSAVSAFVDVRLQAEIVALRQSNVRLITQELRAAQDRFEVGEVTRTDVAIAEARLAAARSGLAAAQGDFQVARERYRAVVGDYPGNLAGLPPLPATARSMEEARMIALRTNSSILQAQRQVTVAQLGTEAAKAATRPSIDLNASISQGLDEDVRRDSLSLSFNQTLYAGGSLSSAYRAALAQKEAAEANLLQTTITVGENVGNAWTALEVAAASIQAGALQVQAAQTAFDGVREEATLGARTTLDVLNAEQELLDARNTRLQAEAQRYVGVYTLLSQMGLLTVEHLNLGVPTYDPSVYYNAVKNAPATSTQGKRLQRILDKIDN